jgi:hypothetical protein
VTKPRWKTTCTACKTSPNTGITQPLVIEHFLYVPSNGSAAGLAEDLKELGYRTEYRASAGARGQWLVKAQHESVLTVELLTRVRREMEKLLVKIRGEYDGWEVTMPKNRPARSKVH